MLCSILTIFITPGAASSEPDADPTRAATPGGDPARLPDERGPEAGGERDVSGCDLHRDDRAGGIDGELQLDGPGARPAQRGPQRCEQRARVGHPLAAHDLD